MIMIITIITRIIVTVVLTLSIISIVLCFVWLLL